MANDGLRRGTWGLLLSAALGALGCSSKATAAFDDKGYEHLSYHYRVGAKQPGDSSIPKENLLGNEWKIDNLFRDKQGNAKQKDADRYMTEFELDFEDDGEVDQKARKFLYDLRFKHLEHDALIWIRTFPISDELRDKDLRVLCQRYVDEVSGAGFENVRLSPSRTMVREQRFGAHVIDGGAFKLAGRKAYQITFDVANVDEIAVDPDARKTRVRIVLVRTPFLFAASTRTPDKSHKFAVLMLAGYANLHEDFASEEPEFTQMLERIEITGKRGTTPVELESATREATDAQPADAPTESVDEASPATEAPASTP